MTPIVTQREAYLRIVEGNPLIDGRFGTPKRLGSNGGGGYFSLMFTAADATTGKQIALKFFNPERAGDSYRVESFQREAALLGELADERYLVRQLCSRSEYVELLTTDTGISIPVAFSYYGMQLAKGSLLDQIAYDRMTTLQGIEAFREVCKTVQYIHRRGVVHRDLKPENLLYFSKNDLKLADLGAARRLTDSPLLPTYAGLPPGDIRYTPPELVASLHDDDPQMAIGTDFFALGAILFEIVSGTLLTGHLFDHAFLMQLLRHMAAVPSSRRRTTFDSIVDRIVDGHPLPSVAMGVRAVPGSVRARIDDLYRSLSHLDYRRRLTSFERIFRQIEICQIVLRNEVKYQRWLELKRRRRLGGSS
jgi:serine/threonine protein kinase